MTEKEIIDKLQEYKAYIEKLQKENQQLKEDINTLTVEKESLEKDCSKKLAALNKLKEKQKALKGVVSSETVKKVLKKKAKEAAEELPKEIIEETSKKEEITDTEIEETLKEATFSIDEEAKIKAAEKIKEAAKAKKYKMKSAEIELEEMLAKAEMEENKQDEQ